MKPSSLAWLWRLGPCLLLPALAASSASAQAWLPTKGEGALGMTLGDYGFDGHFDGTGRRIPYGGTHAVSAAAEVVYGVTNRFAIAGSLPFITSKFTGTFPEGVLLGPLDMIVATTATFRTFAWKRASWPSPASWP